MADLLVTGLVLAGVLLLVIAARRRSDVLLIASGAIFGAAGVVKPILLLWAPLSLLLYWLFSERGTIAARVGVVLMFLALQLGPIMVWSARNLVVDGALTPSSVSARAARVYLGARTEAWVRAGTSPSGSEIRHVQSEVRERFRSVDLSAKEKLRQYRKGTLAIAIAHPWTMVKAYLTNIRESLRGGWDYFQWQLPLSRPTAAPYLAASRIEKHFRRFVPWVISCCVIMQFVVLQIVRTDEAARLFRDTIGLVAMWGYFVALGGITFWAGPRLLYPTQFAVVAVAMLTLRGLSMLINAEK
jgi:hypothetical protein